MLPCHSMIVVVDLCCCGSLRLHLIGFNILSTIYGHVITAATMHACSSPPAASCCATSWRCGLEKKRTTTTNIPIALG